MNKICKIDFWKRSLNSIDKINTYSFTFDDNKCTFLYNSKKQNISDEEINKLIKNLNDLKLESWDDEFKAYLYEDDKNNYNIKYLLYIEEKNHSYIGVKGLYPFKQKDYQKVIDIFGNIKF